MPVTTPSAPRPSASQLASRPSSVKDSGSTSRATRSRTGSLPCSAVFAWWRSGPPARAASSARSKSVLTRVPIAVSRAREAPRLDRLAASGSSSPRTVAGRAPRLVRFGSRSRSPSSRGARACWVAVPAIPLASRSSSATTASRRCSRSEITDSTSVRRRFASATIRSASRLASARISSAAALAARWSHPRTRPRPRGRSQRRSRPRRGSCGRRHRRPREPPRRTRPPTSATTRR